MSPDQAPVASFLVNAQTAGLPTQFDASASISPIGTISSYAWDFGDGTTVITSSPIVNHTYSSTGPFNVLLTVTNSAGTSTSKIFSSRFMSNNGGPTANLAQIITIPPSPPTDVKGYQICFRCPSWMDFINVIKWNPPSVGQLPIAYRIYRDAALTDLIATVPSNGELKFEDNNREKDKSYTYYILSVSASGAVSTPVSITIKPNK
jgi:PKD repeat protein